MPKRRPHRIFFPREIAAVLGVVLLAACAPIATGGSDGSTRGAVEPGLDNLNSVLWIQSSVEYRATALQAYRLARLSLDQALADPSWTAALEQGGSFENLPPAVILDIDETVLDNSYYEARLTLDRQLHTEELWGEWVNQRAATPIPGALDFCLYAASQGVRVFYVSNRRAYLRESTLANLSSESFPLDPDGSNLLMRADIPEWDTSDKGSRRGQIASEYRILLLVGDNMGDFASAASGDLAARRAFAEQYRDRWGSRWITLANPAYGSWLGAVLDNDYGQPVADQIRLKEEVLDPAR